MIQFQTSDLKQNRWFGVFVVGIIFLVLASVLNCVMHVYEYGISAWDYAWVWKECACALRGMDVVQAIRQGAYIDGIGQMPAISATVPWGRIMGNVIHPGFLTLEGAVIYARVLYLLAGIVALFLIAKKLISYNIFSKKMTIGLAICIFCMPFYWTDAIELMNNACVVSLLLMIAVLASEKNEYFAGVCLALAMMKPQIALLFYITFLLTKKIKTIFVSGVILIISWGIYLLLVGGNPIIQVLEIFGQQDQKTADFIWFGLMDFLVKLGIGGTGAMICSMLVGIIGTVILDFLILKSEFFDNNFLLFSVPAFFSTVWCYKSETDLLILIIPSVIIFFVFQKKGINKISVLSGLIYLGLFNVKTFTGGVRRIVGYDWIVGRSLDAWIRMIVYTALIVLLCKYKKTGNEGKC